MTVLINKSDRKMLEIIVFGSTYPEKEFDFRKKIRDEIKKNGFGSCFLVEDFHFPLKNKSKDKRENNSKKSRYFVENQDTGIWIFSIKGKGTGSHTELQYLIDIINGNETNFIKREFLKNNIYGIFEEEKMEKNGTIHAASDVLMGNVPKTQQFYVYPYSDRNELIEMINTHLNTVLDYYNLNNIDRLCKRSLPKPMCEIDLECYSRELENKIDYADYLCKNNNCAKWFSPKYLNKELCPKCKTDVLKFVWD